MRKLIAGLALLGCCTAASADIWYRWQTIDAHGATVPVDGVLRMIYPAWATGSIDYSFSPAGRSGGDPSSPIVSLAFFVNGEAHNWVDEQFRDGLGFADGQLATFRLFGLGDDIDSGEIGSGGTMAPFHMTGAGATWTIDQIDSERSAQLGFNTGPCWMDACAGITGQWVQFIPDPERLPAPASLPLVLLGLAAAGAALRRRT